MEETVKNLIVLVGLVFFTVLFLKLGMDFINFLVEKQLLIKEEQCNEQPKQ